MSNRYLSAAARDAIYVQSIAIEAEVGLDAWQSKRSQPAIISATIFSDTSLAAENDDFKKTINYEEIYMEVRANSADLRDRPFDDVTEMAAVLAYHLSSTGKSVPKDGELEIVLPKAILRCEGGVVFRCSWIATGDTIQRREVKINDSCVLAVRDIKLSCIIGINDYERIKKQQITMDLEVVGKGGAAENWHDLPGLFDSFINYVEASSCQTVEALANWTARKMIEIHAFAGVTVSIRKSNVFAHSQGPGVRITRYG